MVGYMFIRNKNFKFVSWLFIIFFKRKWYKCGRCIVVVKFKDVYLYIFMGLIIF